MLKGIAVAVTPALSSWAINQAAEAVYRGRTGQWPPSATNPDDSTAAVLAYSLAVSAVGTTVGILAVRLITFIMVDPDAGGFPAE